MKTIYQECKLCSSEFVVLIKKYMLYLLRVVVCGEVYVGLYKYIFY